MKKYLTFVMLTVLMFLNFSAFAQFSQPVDKVASDGFKYREIIVNVSVPDTSCFFGCTKGESVVMQGLLWIPNSGDFSPPYKVFVINHGAQNPGSFGSSNISTVRSLLEGKGIVASMLRKGYATIFIARKGFYLENLPKSTVSPESYETNSCNANMVPGLQSAVSDVKAYLTVIATREDLNMQKIIMFGHSRGAITTFKLVTEEYPGIVGIINHSGIWMAETSVPSGQNCPSFSFNSIFFKEFQSIKVPVFSYYGTRDHVVSLPSIKTLLSNFDNNASSSVMFVEGAGHFIQTNDEIREKLEEFLKRVNQ